MAEYIERQKVFDCLPIVTEDKTISLYGAVADFMVLVSTIPSADVTPVVHGRWVDLIPKEEKVWVWDVRLKCSECGYTYSHERKRYSYCPTCGAKMDGDIR